ncbi:MAG: glycoside hydrolase family 88 protein [Bacteroidales bacterium]|nr:glycoside hydrolase family 88 protein [Bacteroidales bacterium]
MEKQIVTFCRRLVSERWCQYAVRQNCWFLITGLLLLILNVSLTAQVQTSVINDSNTPLHALQPDYPVPYGLPEVEQIKDVLDRIYDYLNDATPVKLISGVTGKEITDLLVVDDKTEFARGDFRLISYEWGVTYAGMLLAGEVTGDIRFTDYTVKRLRFIADVVASYHEKTGEIPADKTPVRSVLEPRALDDAGSMCAALIKTKRMGFEGNFGFITDNYIHFISKKEFRLADGTLARNRPLPNTIWLDDLFMSVPALAQMAKLTGERQYFNDAVKQVLQFSKRMFNAENGLFMHGWVNDMDPHPQFHWARANGWAIMAMIELLDVLPENHPGYTEVLELLKAHIRGLAACQSDRGFWHQLLDRHDSYLETSATAIFTYSIARAINCGYVDARAYGPMVLLAWNAVSTKVNKKGQVEGTCVGTGMAFDPAFYAHRPVNVFAAHGYGPVLLAGAEVINLIRHHKIEINDSALMFYDK